MFDLTTLNLAQHYSVALMDASTVIRPSDDNSELHEVISMIPDDVMDNINNEKMYPLIVEHLDPLSGVLDPIVSTWEDALEKVITVLSSTVFPIFSDTLDIAHRKILETPAPDDSTQYAVEIVDLPMWFLNDPAWFTDNNRGTIPTFAALPELLYDPLNCQVVTSTLKATVQKYDSHYWLDKTMRSSLKATAAVFDGKGSSAFLLGLYSSEDPFTRINDATMSILLTKVMEESPPASITVDGNAYRMYLRNVRLLAQSVITRTLPLIRSYVSLDRLIINADISKKTITVFGEVYHNRYLPSGGTADALLGRLISKDDFNNCSDIVKNIKRYTEMWMAFLSSVTSNNSRYQVVQVKRILRRIIDSMAVTEVEEGILGVNAGAPLPSDVKDSMFGIIEQFKQSDMNSLDLFICKLVGTGRFSYINAEEFLSDMVLARLANDSHNAHTAMFVAVINQVATYLASKITVQPIHRSK